MAIHRVFEGATQSPEIDLIGLDETYFDKTPRDGVGKGGFVNGGFVNGDRWTALGVGGARIGRPVIEWL